MLEKLHDVRQSGADQWTARCPAHADSSPSLSIREADDGSVLLHCHAGCKTQEILDKLLLTFEHIGPQRVVRKRVAERSTPCVTRPPCPEPQLIAAPGSARDWGALAAEFAAAISDETRDTLASQLGVTAESLMALSVGWTVDYQQPLYTFPEFDGAGYVVGIATRSMDGAKSFLASGKRGLTLPKGWADGDGPLLIVEGPSDVAALVSAGLSGIGRPSARGGAEQLAELLANVNSSRLILIVGDFDPKPDGSWPGKTGAEHVARHLADALHRKVRITYPPGGCKDVRQWLATGESV